MRAAIVCRQNKARSPFAEAVIKFHFPELHTLSLGLEEDPSEEVSEFAAALAEKWGIGPLKKKAQILKATSNPLATSDLIVIAEDEMRNTLKEKIKNTPVFAMDSLTFHEDLRPIDPDGMAEQQFERELAKVSNVTLRIVYEFLGIKNKFPVTAIVPRSATDIPQALAHAHFEAKNKNAVLIDADCRAPHTSELVEADLRPVDFDFTQSKKFQPPTLDSDSILRHCRELDRPEKYLLSKSWKLLIDHYSSQSEVVIVTAPRRSRSRLLPDSYLSSYFVDSMSLIAS